MAGRGRWLARLARRAAWGAEGALAWPFYRLVALLGPDRGSAASAAVARAIGLALPHTRRAMAQVALAMPETAEPARRAIVGGMWEDIGAIIAEYIHLAAIVRDPARIEVAGGEVIERLAAAGGPVLIFSGHLANWEAAIIAARRHGLAPAMFYRPMSNPLVERVVRRLQSATGAPGIPKTGDGTRRLIDHLEAGGTIFLMVDQRQSTGVPVPFFGRPALTATTLARLSLRVGAPVVPARVERTGRARFAVTFEEPMAAVAGGDKAAAALAFMTAVNVKLEGWIRARPDQWLWLHRRWTEGVGKRRRGRRPGGPAGGG